MLPDINIMVSVDGGVWVDFIKKKSQKALGVYLKQNIFLTGLGT